MHLRVCPHTKWHVQCTIWGYDAFITPPCLLAGVGFAFRQAVPTIAQQVHLCAPLLARWAASCDDNHAHQGKSTLMTDTNAQQSHQSTHSQCMNRMCLREACASFGLSYALA